MTSMSGMRKNEQGMVSILVTMIMIIVITLIVLGFAQVTRRNQREALDNQLSTQAYYAAESGVNAAVNYLTEPTNIGASVDTEGTSCSSFITTLKNAGVSSTLDSSTKTQYTCLMVDTNPPTLSVAPLTQGNNQILYFANSDGAGGTSENYTQLKFSWAPETGSPFSLSTCSGSTSGPGPAGYTLPEYNNWHCAFGVLRLDLVDANSINNTSLDDNDGTTSFYFIPSYTAGGKTQTVSWPPAVQGVSATSAPANCNSGADNCQVQIVPVKCSSSGCSMQLNFSGAGGSNQYFARMTMMYQDASSVIIAGGDAAHSINAVTGVGANFTGGQALIDSTGQSQDELRRIQVRIPLNTSTNTFPAYGLQSTQSICKQIQDGPTLYTDNCSGHP